MKNCILVAFLFLSLTFNAQEKIYFTKDFKEVKSPDLATYYSTYKDSLKGVKRETYFMSGVKRNSIYFTNYKKRIIDGVSYEWNSDAVLVKKETWQKGKKQGVFETYYTNNRTKRTETYDNDKFISGHCYNEGGQEIEFYPYYEKPVFPGGAKEFYKYISQSFKKPNDAKGTIKVKFVVQTDGKLREFEILEGLNYDMNVEVLRVLHSSPAWTPGRLDGEIADISYSIPITIK